MKYVKLGVILLGVALIILGCEKPVPQAPTLIEPEDGAVFDTLPPTFMWSSDELADEYVIRIYMGSSTDIQDTLGDTSYSMSGSLFETLLNGTYNWAAAAMSEEGELFWSESRGFVVNKPEEPQDLDLDTTYFPLGVGYQWCFERYERSEGDDGEEQTWDYERFDTFTVTVTDSSWQGDTMIFTFDFNWASINMPGMMPYCLWDYYEEARFYGDSVLTTIWGAVALVPDPLNPPGDIKYRGDTLELIYHSWSPNLEDNIYINHVIGIGTIQQTFTHQYFGDVEPYPFEDSQERDRLLYFYNGKDTVYKAE
jgi:hypothetical protein